MEKKAHNNDSYLYAGGLAEFVSAPSPLTFSFFENWFTGAKSIGAAMELLKLPYTNTSEPILEMHGKLAFVNLLSEENTLYANTLFKYKKPSDQNESPKLKIDPKKLLNLNSIINTSRIIFVQANLIAKPKLVIAKAQNFIDLIPETSEILSVSKIDEIISSKVLPPAIAIGMLAEYYSHLVSTRPNADKINIYISQQMTNEDWFFKSVADRKLVQKKEISFEEYLDKYGMRASRDYELAMPRWIETPNEIKKNIKNYKEVKKANKNIEIKTTREIDTNIKLQLLRSEAKRKILPWIYILRTEIKKIESDDEKLALLTREEILGDTRKKEANNHLSDKKVLSEKNAQSGQGKGISSGEATGKSFVVKDNTYEIPEGNIAIFPNASPEFSTLYPQCKGIIFLIGGITSHGAIVAREYGIPAIVASSAGHIKSGAKLQINGKTGVWKIISQTML